MKTKILGLLAMGLLAGPVATNAVPTTTPIGNVTIGGDTYLVTLLYDSLGNRDNQSFDALNPSIDFADATSAQAAAQALLDTFGAGFNWSPPADAGNDGVRVAFVAEATLYRYFTVSDASLSVNGLFQQALTGGNDFSFAQFSRAVPEPGTLALLGLGLVGLSLSRRRKA